MCYQEAVPDGGVTEPQPHGLPPPNQGMFQALTEIGQKHGLVGLWRGAVGGLPRVVVGSSTQLCTFSSAKDLLSQWEVLSGKGWDHPWNGELGWRKGGGLWMGWEQQEGLGSLTP